ncbi:4'-phosphopantetheinyl transferase family protein [Streptomyces sp. 142MFCol3.1]|uniref:4'-phosphopantetheinyl transferase family protein n=1 Tax=Streptomyces sp. 142MFCol3.1 TaxID=1172179 RepID=UPI0003F6CC55|nr:4'-phosphopantetheinyl transferase superfamily protein [Streptomyces sp. 142MFCol3.1]
MTQVMTRTTTTRRLGPPAGEVHVWAVREPGPGNEKALWRCLALLSRGELRRWRTMVPSQRALHASAHAALRSVTAAYAGRHPSEVAFVRGRLGKPHVAGDPGLRVSLAHTEGMSLVAVSRDGPVGVDVERIRPLRDPAGLRRQVLSDEEAERWPADREGPLNSGLFTHWACKEAVLKALGSGLAGDLTAVRVDPGARREGAVRVHAAPGSAARAWNLRLVDVGPEFRAAVAVAGGGGTVRLFALEPGERPQLPFRSGPRGADARSLPASSGAGVRCVSGASGGPPASGPSGGGTRSLPGSSVAEARPPTGSSSGPVRSASAAPPGAPQPSVRPWPSRSASPSESGDRPRPATGSHPTKETPSCRS